MGVAVVGTDSLSERAAKMRESLQKSQTITDSVVSILGSFDHRLSVLETAMRPTQVHRLTIFLFGSLTVIELGSDHFDFPFTWKHESKNVHDP